MAYVSETATPMGPVTCPDPEELLRQARSDRDRALGQLLELYRNYLAILARLQIGRRLQGKADAADLVQETFLDAHRHFGRFRGTTEGEFAAWLRQILAGRLAMLVRRYLGTQRRDVRLERELALVWTNRPAPWIRGWWPARALPASKRRVASKRLSWQTPWVDCLRTTEKSLSCATSSPSASRKWPPAWAGAWTA